MSTYCPERRTLIMEALIAGSRACDIQQEHGLTSPQYYHHIRAGRKVRAGTKVNVPKHIAAYLAENGRSPQEILGDSLRLRVAAAMGVAVNGHPEPNPDNAASLALTDEIQEDLQMFSILCSRLLRTDGVPDEVYSAVDMAQHRVWQWTATPPKEEEHHE